MKFSNVVLLCKGWYKIRQNNENNLFWMDMAHAINADGYTMRTKHDVVDWCLFRLDDMRDDPKLSNYKNQFRLKSLFNEIERNIYRFSAYTNINVTQEDAIILAFRDIVSNLDNSCFDEAVKPNKCVLPLNLKEAWYDDGKYSKKPQLYPAEMMCDFMETVNKYLSDAKDQNINEDDYDWIEGFLLKDSYKDVQIELGEDNLNDCIEVECTALDIKNQRISGVFTELDKFNNCRDLKECKDPDKTFTVRVSVEITHYDSIEGLGLDDITYHIKSIKEKINKVKYDE